MFKLRRKLIPLLLALFIFNSTYAQSEKIDLSIKNESLRQLIKQIETKTDYSFMLDQTVDQSQKVSVEARQESLDAILKKAFAGKQISYEVVGKQIILKISRNSQSSQSRKISGTVKDQNGESVIGANVSVKGTTIGTITDIDGNFILEVPDNVVIQISYIGYITQEISLGNKEHLDILLKEDLQSLDEIVVIGYGTAKRKDFTGSVSSVKLENSPISLATNTNALESLKGNVTGLDIGATNTAGGTPSMQIRGQNSISGSNDPLVVVDGVIFMGSVNDINPNDIASYDVLKDATSAAAYGSRSANGVIIITTKKGKQGKPVIHFNAKGSMQSWHLKPELMNGEQWLDATSAANGYSDYSFLVPQEELNLNSGKEINWLDEISRTGWTQDYKAYVS